MKCKKCGSNNLQVVWVGPHKKLVCVDCLTYQKFLSKAECEIFNHSQDKINFNRLQDKISKRTQKNLSKSQLRVFNQLQDEVERKLQDKAK